VRPAKQDGQEVDSNAVGDRPVSIAEPAGSGAAGVHGGIAEWNAEDDTRRAASAYGANSAHAGQDGESSRRHSPRWKFAPPGHLSQRIEGSNTPLTDLFHNLPPPPQAAQQTQRIRVGGGVEAASIINRVMPQYPAIAKTAHVSGTIVLHAIIAKDGTVQELTYISGSPLLIKAAIDAVREWRYRPTMLNGEPVEVETTIVVVFNLGG
jgi:TonB family protein